jgi:quercetin dioxygenase-like cupin family protein
VSKIDERIYKNSLHLSTAIDYQKESIVSQTLLGKETGTVTLFAFSKNEGLSEHTAPFDAMVHVIEGTVEIKISGTPYILNTGDAIVMPANEPHALQAIADFKMLLIMIKS